MDSSSQADHIVLLASPVRWPLVSAAILIVACTAKSAGLDPPNPTVADVRMTPDSIVLVHGDSVAFTAQALQENGAPIGAALAWSATGGTVSASGRYHAGSTPGIYRVMVSTTDLALADTSIVTIADTIVPPPPPTVAQVQVTPGSVTLPMGGTAAFTAQGYQANGTPIAVAVGWSATGGTVSNTGQYQAGGTAGTYRVIARATNLSLADTALVTITDTTSPPPPPTVAQIQVTPATATLPMGATAAFAAQGYQANGTPIAVSVAWSATGGTVSGGGQYRAGATSGTYRVIASMTSPSLADTALVTITDTATPPPGATVLLTESFEDAAVAGRGWYDNTSPAISTVEHFSGVGALQMAFAAGGTIPAKGSSVRHKFAATDRVFLRYWVKYSANWVGSGVSYHPHEFHFITNLDGDFVGPAATHLTTYIEHGYQNGGYPRLALQDALNIDATKINVNLTGQTELRGANGCNGNTDGYPTGCYQVGTQWRNEKIWTAAAPSFTPGPGPGYKNAWHKVEAYFQLNSIQGGVGVADGVAQYWFDGQLVIDHHNVLMRTGQHPSMQFTQFIIAPYIGVGSPVAQTMWVDDLLIATGPVP